MHDGKLSFFVLLAANEATAKFELCRKRGGSTQSVRANWLFHTVTRQGSTTIASQTVCHSIGRLY